MSKQSLLSYSALAGLLAMPTASYAQQQAQGQTAQISGIEEIVVTSRRREENLQSVPIAVAAFTESMLEDRSIKRFEDVAAYVPNLIMNSTNRPNNARIFIRGVGGGDTFAYRSFGVALYVDGLYFADSVGAYSAAFDIDRIEVLRGPQGTLFGKNTTGGAIVVVSKKPGPDPETTFQLDYGRFNYNRIKASTNVVLVPDTLFARFGMNYESDDGYYKELNTGRGWSDIENRTGRLAVRWTPNDEWTVDVGGTYIWEPRMFNGGTCKFLGVTPNGSKVVVGSPEMNLETACNATAAAGDYKFYSDVGGMSHTRTRNSSVRAEYAPNHTVAGLDNFSAALQVGYRYTNHSFMQDADFTMAAVQQQSTDPDTVGGRDNTTWSSELLINGDGMGGRLHLTGGIYYFADKAGTPDMNCWKAWEEIKGTPGATRLCSPPGTSFLNETRPGGIGSATSAVNIYVDNYSAAGFVNATYDITDAFKAEIGGRWTKDHRESRTIEFNYTNIPNGAPLPILAANTITGHSNNTFSYEKFTWKGSLSYQFGGAGALDDGNFYASISTGFNAGGTNTEGGQQLLSLFPTYEPETVTNYEAGLKTTWAEGRVRANLAVFQADYKDKQFIFPINNAAGTLPGDPTLQVTLNVARQRVQGVEFEGMFSPVGNLLIETSASYLKNRYLDTSAATIPPFLLPFVEANLPGPNVIVADQTPEWRANLAASYAFEMGTGATITPRFNIVTQAAPRENASTTNSSRKINPRTGERGVCYDGGPTKVDGRITWENADRDATVALYGTNLTNRVVRIACTSGVVETSGNPGVPQTPTGNGIYTETREAPWKWGITTTFRF